MTLYRYVLREYLRFVFITVFFTSFLFILFDFVHKSTGFFGKYGFQPWLVFLNYFYQLPFQIYQALPVASMIGGVATMVMLHRSGEVTAMRATGLSPVQIILPLAFGGGLFSLLSFGLGEWVVPMSAAKAHYVSEVLIRGDDAKSDQLETQWIRLGSQIFHFERYNPSLQTFERVQLMTLGDSFSLTRIIYAAKAHPLDQQHLWRLEGVKEISYSPSRELTHYESLPTKDVQLEIPVSSLTMKRRDPLEMSLSELDDSIQSGEAAGLDIKKYLISWHLKVAFHFAALLLSLLSLPFGYRSERTPETLRSLGVAFGIGLGYWVFLSAGKVLASVGSLPPLLAAWLANIWIIVVVAWQLSKVYRVP